MDELQITVFSKTKWLWCVFVLHTVLRFASLHWFEIVSRLSENVDAECHQLSWRHDTWDLSGSSSDHFPSLNVFHFLFEYVLGYIWVLHPDLNKQNSTVSLCSIYIYIYIYTVVLFLIMVKSCTKSGWRQWGHLIKIKARMLIIGVYLRIWVYHSYTTPVIMHLKFVLTVFVIHMYEFSNICLFLRRFLFSLLFYL